MHHYNLIWKSWMSMILFLSLNFSLGSQNLDLNFNSKDYQESETALINRLDNDRNYVIIFSAFWCNPCVKNINEIYSKNIERYREEYNLEIIIIDNDHFDNPHIALNKMKRNQWYFDMFFIEEKYSAFGITGIPVYFFKAAGATEAYKIFNNDFERAVEQHYITQNPRSIFKDRIAQSIVNTNCNKALFEFGIDTDTIIDKLHYFKVSNHYYRSGIQSKSIYRYNPNTALSEVVLDMTLDVCDEFTLIDSERDSVIITIESIDETNGYLELITNKNIIDDCTNSIIPFKLSDLYGSNAGIHFDIEDGEIVTKLACHNVNSNISYTTPDLQAYCIPSHVIDDATIQSIRIQPNPASDQIRISSDIQFKAFKLFNQVGQLSKEGLMDQSQELNVASLNNGAYFLKLQDEFGNNIITKFIKM